VSGWPLGYSGPKTPWHTFDLFSRGHIWNSQHAIDVGMSHGLLLMQRSRPSYSAQIIYNPLFAELSTTPPVGNDCED
jgi:hypothetical protein